MADSEHDHIVNAKCPTCKKSLELVTARVEGDYMLAQFRYVCGHRATGRPGPARMEDTPVPPHRTSHY